jgi:hypothetical protein
MIIFDVKCELCIYACNLIYFQYKDNAQGERDLAILAYNNEKKESCRWYFSYQDKDRRVQELLREKFAKQLLHQQDTNRL